jgi:2-succinyl-5-enolpyruvyl-6-hydroxy-3-cyclohexene-1-carboxylate synthase
VTQSYSQQLAASVIAELAAGGVRNFYLAPGARSQALAIAAGQLFQADEISLTVVLDERSMGFAALGRALATGTPSVLIVTSGTAVANLHPAVLEAHHSGVPMILLTADRPAKLRGTGANQTTNQVGIFADALRGMVDLPAPTKDHVPNVTELIVEVIAGSLGTSHEAAIPGVVQLNLQFEEPLSGYEPTAVSVLRKKIRRELPTQKRHDNQLAIAVGDGSVVIAGAGAGFEAQAFAQAANLPLFAEPSSGSRFGENVIVNYQGLLATELFDQVSKVIVFGKPTLSRPIQRLIKNTEVWVIKDTSHGHFNAGLNALGFADGAKPEGKATPAWLDIWKQQDEPASGTRAKIARMLWEATGDKEQLLFAASELIRQADKAVGPKQIKVFSNRGLAGIDGTISTGLGLAQSGLKTRVLLGDLALLHDVGGLNLSGFGDLDLQLIIGNDNGGEIFSKLEMAKLIEPAQFELMFRTPQKVNMQFLANAYGWQYFKISETSELEPLLRLSGFVLVEFSL